MSHEGAFDAWAPPGGRWSNWVKPVLFAHMSAEVSLDDALPLELPEVGWAPAPEDNVALVVDLRGDLGVRVGVALAARGYQPVPLYNACPARGLGGGVIATAVDVEPIMRALERGAAQVRAMAVPPGAPPAFLLDARRRGTAGAEFPGSFDNRAVCFPTDFPSGRFLLGQGIRRALLVQSWPVSPQPDLAHTLLRWRELGVEVLALGLENPTILVPCAIQRPRWYRAAMYRVLTTLGFHRNVLGGFGGLVPSGGGG